ncbi:hypothetical protein EV361DRAFT_642097 [Lentinula raphanica]|uniref:Uncharacterized protein n=1 Tax=Lentinula raphanica TaxID=153919 RepID=A0AA38PC49_9AGAR|nr:hypothetical protein F5880DRAFT_1295021 [Lentinula raphanica]KAJ3840189.1 hypothetical protein F5878DRAFT_81543 [Lentinula raphanica]KAJ3974471.1 hypothetical protein EV361DRAFT_642097 [Lentinula raphanica]
MSGSSYLLEKPRRQPPAPLHFEHASYHPKTGLNSQSSPTLLYDLPSATSLSPPTSPTSMTRLASPPTSPGRSRPHHAGRPTPSPGGRKRSVTPLGVAASDLEKFSAQCRNWYFKQDEEAGRLMTQTMANLPPAQRAPYTRLQASIRSAYHRSVNARKTAEFRAHLSATQPGASLTPYARANPRGSDARKERYESFERFVRSWCSMGMPGPQPFFQALWAVMRLQAVPENIGGAGRYRIEWEFDDAVLKEAAGKDFMLEAIDILKGVLAFEEAPSSRMSPPPSGEEDPDATITHSRSQSSPFLPERKDSDTLLPKRARAPSDPFLDTPMLSRSVGSSSSNMTTLLVSDSSEEPLVPGSILNEDVTPIFEPPGEDSEEGYMRTWTSPDLTNPEYLNLVKVFPSHITRRPVPYFPISSAKKPSDLEAALDDAAEVGHVRCGTGTLRVSPKQRSDGWEGSWWTRFIMWWRRLFS